ncbi:hypothetical protein ACEWY4_020593 [Coilia grayii]|uniref:Receptor protein-tyrosine kinase n=1 Tax=Coilia grayii TaxID=363190 RepID=A0ABD1J6J4_9TELE
MCLLYSPPGHLPKPPAPSHIVGIYLSPHPTGKALRPTALSKQASNALSKQASNALSKQASNALSKQASNALSNQASNALSKQASNALSKQASNALSKQASNALSKQASNALSKQASNALSNQASNALSKQASNALSKQASNALSKQASNALSKQASNALSKQASNALSKQASNALSNQASNALSNQASNALSKQASNALSKQASNALSKQASNALSKQASNALSKQASNALSKQASNALSKQASNALLCSYTPAPHAAATGLFYNAKPVSPLHPSPPLSTQPVSPLHPSPPLFTQPVSPLMSPCRPILCLSVGEVLLRVVWKERLESGGVTLKEPASEADLESAQPVTLRCHIDGHPRPTCKWFKDGVQQTDKMHQISSKERTLTVRSAGPDDNGLYYCCARNAAGQVCSNSNFTLNIIDKSFPRPVVVPEDQVVLRNGEAMFHCQFTAEPPPIVEWFHEAEPVVNKTRVALYSNGTLHIIQVKGRSVGTYRCVAHGATGRNVTVQATLSLAEIQDLGPGQAHVFTANAQEQISCQAGGTPEPQVTWELPEGLPAGTDIRIYQEGGALMFNPTQRGDSGTYICTASNKAGKRTQEHRVTVASAPEWLTPPSDSSMREGQPGFLHCHAQATPTPEVTWYRSSMLITSEDSRFTLFPNGTLRINSVEVYDGVMFGCQTRNIGGFLTGQAKVKVLERLKFTPTPQAIQCLQLDKEVSVQCSATGEESPSILWTRADGSELPPRVEQKNGVLRFSKVTRDDAGNYTCVASNHLQGEIRAYVSFTVGVSIQFRLKPEYTTVYQGHTAMLQCQASGEPEPSLQWIVKDKMLSTSSGRFQVMQNGSLVISDVVTDDTGRYTCVAGNSCGISDHAAQLYVVEKPVQPSMDEEDKAPYKMIQTIGLSVGAAVAYIIAVLGLMFYCKQRRNAKRLLKGQQGEEPEMECLNGAAGGLQNGQTTAEIQEEVALTDVGTMATAEKRHSANDKLHFPRAHLQTITTLGKGEFGEVLLAKARGIEEGEEETVVLVKSLQARDEQLQQDFRREADMFAKLSHPNIVRLLGLCRDTDPHCLILEYVDLGDLKQFLRISKSKDEKIKPQPISTKTKARPDTFKRDTP